MHNGVYCGLSRLSHTVGLRIVPNICKNQGSVIGNHGLRF